MLSSVEKDSWIAKKQYEPSCHDLFEQSHGR